MCHEYAYKEVRQYFSKLGKKGGRKGGHARAAKLTPERRPRKREKGEPGPLGKEASQLNLLAQSNSSPLART